VPAGSVARCLDFDGTQRQCQVMLHVLLVNVVDGRELDVAAQFAIAFKHFVCVSQAAPSPNSSDTCLA
jgi:hypothetical protein